MYLVGLAIVRHIDVEHAVAVQVGDRDAYAFTRVRRPRGRGDVRECAVADPLEDLPRGRKEGGAKQQHEKKNKPGREPSGTMGVTGEGRSWSLRTC